MNTKIIDDAFAEMINTRGIHNKLGITSEAARSARYNFNTGERPITLDTKLRLLQKSGWRQPAESFSRKDMIDFAKAWHKAGQSKKDLGIEYFLEHWQKKN